MWQVSYAAVGGPGVIMRILCFFCCIISFCASLAAVGFIWVRLSLNGPSPETLPATCSHIACLQKLGKMMLQSFIY